MTHAHLIFDYLYLGWRKYGEGRGFVLVDDLNMYEPLYRGVDPVRHFRYDVIPLNGLVIQCSRLVKLSRCQDKDNYELIKDFLFLKKREPIGNYV